VVEVDGQVTATRDGKTRTLAPGDDVSPDDLVATNDTGSVGIELFHNRANLQLQNGATSRIDDSLAWELTKSDVAKLPGGKVMVSAGRHGEQTAAQSASNVVTGERRRDADAVPVTATATEPATAPAIQQPMAGGVPGPMVKIEPEPTKTTKKKTGTGAIRENGEPPPAKDPVTRNDPPPPPPQSTTENATKPDPAPQGAGSSPGRGGESPKPPDTAEEDKGGAGKGKQSKTTDENTRAGKEREKDDSSSLLDSRVEGVRAKLKACLKGDVKHLTITVTVSAGKLTFGFAETGAEAARACVQGVLKQVDVKDVDGTASIELSL
jgi:hypothetical protein